jgi:hypothetical protein
MSTFIAAVIAVIVVAFVAAYALDAAQTPASMAYTTQSVRL